MFKRYTMNQIVFSLGLEIKLQEIDIKNTSKPQQNTFYMNYKFT